MSTIRWGVLGTARIAEQQVIPALKKANNGKVVAVASRTLARAKEFAQANEIPNAYGSYEELLNDENIDAIYIPLPNHLHYEWTLAAARHGKHVLCEKPAALSARQVREMLAVCRENGVVFMEAFMYRFHPQWSELMQIVQSGELGEVIVMDSAFSFRLENQADFRLDSNKGGGALYDLGCYCVHAIRTVVGNAEVTDVQAVARFAQNGTLDRSLAATLHFAGGSLAHFDCSFEATNRQYFQVAGSKGTATLSLPFRPDLGDATLTLDTAHRKQVVTLDYGDMYVRQVEHFAECILNGIPPLNSGQESIRNSELIEALLHAARNQKTGSTMTPTRPYGGAKNEVVGYH